MIRRCDSSVICDLTDQIVCSTAGPNTKGTIDTKAVCTYRQLDINEIPIEGVILCNEREQYSAATNKYKFKTSCAGSYAIGGSFSCTIAFKSGKLFEESGTCPPP